MAEKSVYEGKVSNAGVQEIKAPLSGAKAVKGKKITGKDLRSGK